MSKIDFHLKILMEFTDLPPEMVAAIIDHIPIPERHITRLISTQFRDICHDKSRKIKQEGDMSIAAAFGDTIANSRLFARMLVVSICENWTSQ